MGWFLFWNQACALTFSVALVLFCHLYAKSHIPYYLEYKRIAQRGHIKAKTSLCMILSYFFSPAISDYREEDREVQIFSLLSVFENHRQHNIPNSDVRRCLNLEIIS